MQIFIALIIGLGVAFFSLWIWIAYFSKREWPADIDHDIALPREATSRD